MSSTFVAIEVVPAATMPGTHPDFDGDGFGDYAVGAAGENRGAGAVYVFYGAEPAAANRLLFFDQATAGIPGITHDAESLGASLASGDFNGDGYDDLAAGIPGDVIATKRAAGSVLVLYGSANGLTAAGSELWHQDVGQIASTTAPAELFSTALAAGDFNDDLLDDLAIGIPGERINGRRRAGAVAVLNGCVCGLTDIGSRRFTQATNGIAGIPELSDNFGYSLAVGRFGGDEIDDLAIGVPGDFATTHAGAGAVHILRGASGTALDPSTSQTLTERNFRNVGSAGRQVSDFFGWSIAAGDLNLDGIDDLAVGAPGEASGAVAFAGAVFVATGDADLLGLTMSQMLNQETTGIPGGSRRGQEFGHSVLIARLADVDGGGADDVLVIGVPFEDLSGAIDGGQAHVLFPSVAGATATDSVVFTLNTDGVLGAPTRSGWFGATLGAVDTDADGLAELLVGSPGEDVGKYLSAGALTRFGDAMNAPSNSGSVHWTENSPGVVGSARKGDYFTSAVTFPR